MSNTQWPTPDQLIDLAKNNPDELERFKRREIDKLIEQSSESSKRRLRGLQFQIDCKRRLHSNPLAFCIEISQMMFESVTELNEALNGDHIEPPKSNRIKSGSDIIPFPAAVN